ncbi:MAG: PAS domain-containing protein, partial [Pseudomonadales bacterium]
MKFTAYDNLPCPIFMADPNGRLTYVNHAWREYLGSGSGELWTKPFDDVQQTDLRHAWKRCCEADESFTITSKVNSTSGIRWYDIECRSIDHDVGKKGV